MSDSFTVFAEFPVDNIVAVHWDDEGPPPEPPDHGPPYCGRYGWGLYVEDPFSSVIPYGPNQLPPMTGTFFTASNTGPEGERYGGLNRPLLYPVETLTAFEAMHVTNIFLDGNAMTFTNNQLIGLQDSEGNRGTVRWRVPMAEGQDSAGVGRIVKSYTIDMEWFSHLDLGSIDEVGIGISHPIPHWTGALPQPPEPAMVLGLLYGGSASFVYDFKPDTYWQTPINESNQFDPDVGGPVYLWWMQRQEVGIGQLTAWGATSQFMVTTVLASTDYYIFEIVAECQRFHPPT